MVVGDVHLEGCWGFHSYTYDCPLAKPGLVVGTIQGGKRSGGTGQESIK